MAAKVKPGKELDEKVARIIGQKGRIALRYSTDMGAAWRAWEWLEANFKLTNKGFTLFLGRAKEGNPSVTMGTIRAMGIKVWEGETYPHAISLAVVEADEWLQK